jgi:hypothetical protein
MKTVYYFVLVKEELPKRSGWYNTQSSFDEQAYLI